jgi:hypothetical protein
LIRFGRFARQYRQGSGAAPETFNFLGFTHSCGKTRQGWFTVPNRGRASLKSTRRFVIAGLPGGCCRGRSIYEVN